MSKQGTAGKSKHVIVMIPQKLEIIRRLESGEAEVRLWLHTTLDCHAIKNGKTNYDNLWHYMKA